jgi:hypothetical protein
LQLEMPWYARPMFNPKALPLGALIVVALLISGLLFVSRPVQTTLAFDNQPDHTVSVSDRGPTRLLLRMTNGAQAQITSVTADPADSVRILAQPGACTKDRTLTTNVPVCALWIEPGQPADKPARVRIAWRTPGEADASEIVLRVR